ncbi:MAG: hypothetical protein ACAH95_03770 [Fimbriimonas sp.]
MIGEERHSRVRKRRRPHRAFWQRRPFRHGIQSLLILTGVLIIAVALIVPFLSLIERIPSWFD